MENALVLGIGCFIAALILMFIGIPIAIGLGMGAVIFFYILQRSPSVVPDAAFNAVNNFVLTAIPMYILMGEILVHTGISDRLYQGAIKWLAWLPGGLLHANIASCALFAAISGSSPATAATIGTVAIPALEKRGYETKITLGSLAAGGTLGILIPPSINLIVYGALTGASVARLFAGGVFPGIMLSLLFMFYIFTRVMFEPMLAPKEQFSLRALPSSFFDIWPLIVIMVIVLGGIFGGVFTPTEAAAVGAVAALVIGFGYRTVTWKVLKDSFRETVTITSMVLFIVIGASMIATFSAMVQMPGVLGKAVVGSGLSKWAILACIYLLYIFLGLFIDGLSAMIMTLPAILPIISMLGFDVIWFGVILVILTEIGLLTPPVAVNVFVIQAISGKPLSTVYRGSTPFFFIMIIALILVTVFPEIITWLAKAITV